MLMSTQEKHNSRLPNLNDTQFSSKNYLLIWFLCNLQLKESKNLCSTICNKFQAFLMYIWGNKARCWWQYSLKLSLKTKTKPTSQTKNPHQKSLKFGQNIRRIWCPRTRGFKILVHQRISITLPKAGLPKKVHKLSEEILISDGIGFLIKALFSFT